MRTTPILIAGALALVAMSGYGQGTFQNLGFESASLTPIPPGQYGGPVSVTAALPGWTGYLGTNQVTQVLQNNATLGNASIDIFGPNWSGGGRASIIEGQYTVALQAGVDPSTGPPNLISASISQTGLVPANAESLQFKATPFSFTVSFAGQTLPLVALGSGANYTLYGADISSFAGQTGALTITALPVAPTLGVFDSFQFSNQRVPEPGIMGLSASGALVLGWRVLRRLR